MPSPDPAPLHGRGALRRIVRLAARTLGTDAAQFVPSDGGGDAVVYGPPVELRGLGLDTLVKDGRGLVVTDTVGAAPFAPLAPAVRFVAAVPVVGAQRHGALCLLDGSPRSLDAAEQQTLAEFGGLAADVADGGHGSAGTPRGLFDGHTALMLLVDPQSGGIVEVNAAAAAFYGCSVEEMAGRSLATLSVLPEDRVLPALRRTLRDERPVLRLRYRAVSGEVRTVELIVSAVTLGGRSLLHAVGRDVTDEHRTVERLRRWERNLRGFYDHAPTMMGIVELAGEDLLHVSDNEAAARFYGTTVEAMEGRTSSELGIPKAIGAQWAEAYRQSALNGAPVRFAYDHPHPRGHRRLAVVVTCIGVSAEGMPQFSYIAEDVTERMRAEAVVPTMWERTETVARGKDDLLTSLDHEIRTPLAALVGFSEALDEAVAAEHRDVSGLLVRSGHRLLGTIDSVLDLARLEAGPAEVARVPVDVAAEVETAAQLLRPLAERKGLQFDVWVTALPPVPADPALVARIVTNLVGNALAFTEEGGVAVEVEAVEDEVVLRVRDTGAGVNEAFLPRRADALEAGHEEEGSVAITRRLVDLLGGTLDVASRKGKGTTFTVCLPRHADPPEQETAPEQPGHVAQDR